VETLAWHMPRDRAHGCACESDDDLVDQRIHEEQMKEAVRDGGEPVTLWGRLGHRLRGPLARARR
jgi:hypothetical protein